ncbi:MAG: hypothetical protein M9894_31020 [Planctomycetes bacterium]|nr:hypothetical protein [Planctomycetota bacterium]
MDAPPPLAAPSSRARADAASQVAAAEAFDALDAVRGLLADDAPFAFRHAGALHVSEVRMRALEALGQLYRAARLPAGELGEVAVRKAMPGEEAVRRAQEALEGLDEARRAEVAARASAFLDDRVRPASDEEREVLLAYRVLQELGRVAYRQEELDPATYLTPTQREVAFSQLARERPRPHLCVLAGGELLGYVWREPAGRWVLDFASVPAAADALHLTRSVLGRLDPGGVPRVVRDAAGRPRRDDDGALVLDGVVPLDAPDAREVLRSVAAFLEDPFAVALIE